MEFAHYKCFIIIIIIFTACNLKKNAVLKGLWSASRDSGRQQKKDMRMR